MSKKYKLVDNKLIDEDGNEFDISVAKVGDFVDGASVDAIGDNDNDDDDDVADALTKDNLQTTLKTIIDEKLKLNKSATDDEDEVLLDEDEKEKGLGLFPILLIGGISVVGIATLFLKNRPISSPEQTEEQNHG